MPAFSSTIHLQGQLPSGDVIKETLETVRSLLDMDFCYLSEARDDRVHFRHVTPQTAVDVIAPDRSVPLTDMYCSHIASGTLPPLIADTAAEPLVRDLKFTRDARIKSLISVPVYRDNGSLYGMFCCFSQTPKPNLNKRDVEVVKLFAGLASKTLNKQLQASEQRAVAAQTVRHAIDTDVLDIYLQPIVSLSNNTVMAVEALSRFKGDTLGGPLAWFDLAAAANLAIDLELAAISKALRLLPSLPERLYLTVNAGPETISSPRLMQLLRDVPPERLVVELTEHHAIKDLPALVTALDVLRARDIGIAIDDVGAGHAGLSTVLELNAHVLKLDRGLVCNVDKDPAKQALCRAMVNFANDTGAFLIAEGVERAEEHGVLHDLGLRLGQGYFYARPTPAAAVIHGLAINETADNRMQNAG